MRWLLSFLLFASCTMTLHADTFIYASMAPEKKIQAYRLNPKDGSLIAIDAIAVEGGPGSLCVDPDGKFLFASLRTIDSLASFRIDRQTGKLTHINTILRAKGANAAFVRYDPISKSLFSASYMGGDWSVHQVEADGTLNKTASGRTTTAKTAHAIVFDPSYRWLFVPHVEPNAIYQYQRTKSGVFGDTPAKVVGASNGGPRHLAFHPTLKLAFASDEVGNSITAYQFDQRTGLIAIQTLSTLPVDFNGKNTTAEVKVHPDGKFVWVSNRGHDSLAGFAIEPTSGKLTKLGQTPTEKTPRSFEIDPDGRWLFGAGEGSGKLAVYRIDRDSGKLDRVHTVNVGKSVTWVMAVKFK